MTGMGFRPGTLVGDDYEIVRLLSEGGMGAVYVARQRSTGEERALKVMLPAIAADATLREKFMREAQMAARIASDHVVRVIQAGVDEQSATPWLVMELLRGEDLASRVKREGRLDRRTAENLLGQLGFGLAASHDAGVVHRDLKPENLFLTTPRSKNAETVLKILDFGIAKITADAATHGSIAIGTPFWMAPEQTSVGIEINFSTDVWAFGLIAFYLFTGKMFWMAASTPNAPVFAVMRELGVDLIPSASQRAAALGAPSDALPAGFDGWFARCVVREQSARFRHARDAASALEAVLAGAGRDVGATPPQVPISPRTIPMTPSVSASPPMRRRSWLIALGAGVVVSGVVVAAVVAARSPAPPVATATLSLPSAASTARPKDSAVEQARAELVKPCWAVRQPTRWAARASKEVPIMMEPDGARVRIGFGVTERDAAGLIFDPKTGSIERVFDRKASGTGTTPLRVLPMAHNGNEFLTTESQTDSVYIRGKEPFFVHFESNAISWSSVVDGARQQLFRLDPPATVQATQVLDEGERGYFVSFRHGNAVTAARFDSRKQPIAGPTTIGALTSSSKVGKPRSAFNGEKTAVVFAATDDQDGPWNVRIARTQDTAIPVTTTALPLPDGGPGGDAIAADLVGLSSGRWLAMWTEGRTGSRSIRAQTYTRNFELIEDPIAISPPGDNYGQSTMVRLGEYVITAFLAAPAEDFELWGSVLRCE